MEDSNKQAQLQDNSFHGVHTANFRAKALDTGKFVYGDLVHLDDDTLGIVISEWKPILEAPDEDGAYTVIGKCYKIDTDTIGEKLGFSDEDDHAVYSGDIIEVYSEKDFKGLGLITYDNYSDSFCIQGPDIANYPMNFWEYDMYGYTFRVAGNKYDNPGLGGLLWETL